MVVIATVSAATAARANQSALDATFGTAGEASLDLPGYDQPTAMVRTATGGIAVTIENGGVQVAVLTSDGRLDTTFAGSGIKEMGPEESSVASLAATRGAGLAATPDGGLLVATYGWDSSRQPVPGPRFTIAKLLADGQLDVRYGTGGLATTAAGELSPLGRSQGVNQFAVTPDGSAVVVGMVGPSGDVGGVGAAALVRFTPSGVRDEGFGVKGIAPVAGASVVPLMALAIAPDGGILVSETLKNFGAAEQVLVRRFVPRGGPDLSFGVAGIVRLSIPGRGQFPTDFVVDGRGRIVWLGYTSLDRFSPPVVARLLPGGQMDTTFGEEGIAVFHTDRRGTSFDGSGASFDGSGAIALTDSGAYLTVQQEGFTFDDEGVPKLRNHLLRMDDNGRLDTGYGGDQSIELPMHATAAVIVLPDRVVVAGYRSYLHGNTVLAAYTAAATASPSESASTDPSRASTASGTIGASSDDTSAAAADTRDGTGPRTSGALSGVTSTGKPRLRTAIGDGTIAAAANMANGAGRTAGGESSGGVSTTASRLASTKAPAEVDWPLKVALLLATGIIVLARFSRRHVDRNNCGQRFSDVSPTTCRLGARSPSFLTLPPRHRSRPFRRLRRRPSPRRRAHQRSSAPTRGFMLSSYVCRCRLRFGERMPDSTASGSDRPYRSACN